MMAQARSLLALLLAVVVICSSCHGMTIPTIPSHTPAVSVTPVETEQDWIAFADLRYDEWINNNNNKENGGTTGTSRAAFRCATRDIYLEERPRSCLVLAKYQTVVVGAAEMSPYEVEAGLNRLPNGSFSAWYVTDVVTAARYRRQGIARRMMDQLETRAIQSGTTHLVLNVKRDNLSALRLYQQLGYDTPSSELLEFLDISKLEKEAGTEGQLLLEKKLNDITIPA
jgi:GNAT superfamily N-acetyltransferase